MKGLQLNTEEKQLLVEALLFTSCTDVCAEHTDPQRQKMIELAQKINKDVGKLYNIYLYAESIAEDDITKIVSKQFVNLPVTTLITD